MSSYRSMSENRKGSFVPLTKLIHYDQDEPNKTQYGMSLSPEHPDIMEFLSKDMRASDLFLAVWLSDEFMKQVESDGDWYLMDPDECPGLSDAFGEDFVKLYYSYVESKKYRKKIKAQEIWRKIRKSNPNPYLLYKEQH